MALLRPPRICSCGLKVAHGATCVCQRHRDAERKARFDAKRPSARARGYDSKWDKARAAYLAVHPTCVRCGEPATVVDHILAHRGDLKLFWSRSNWQPLCRSCHSGAKQREEARFAYVSKPDGGVGENFARGSGTGGGSPTRKNVDLGFSTAGYDQCD